MQMQMFFTYNGIPPIDWRLVHTPHPSLKLTPTFVFLVLISCLCELTGAEELVLCSRMERTCESACRAAYRQHCQTLNGLIRKPLQTFQRLLTEVELKPFCQGQCM